MKQYILTHILIDVPILHIIMLNVYIFNSIGIL